MADVRIELIPGAFEKLLSGAEISELLEKTASEIAVRAGAGYESDLKQMPTRKIASVYTATEEAMQDNLENNTILKAVGK